MVRLIADSGSTKTDWALVDDSGVQRIATSGLNPVVLGAERFSAIIASELLPRITHIREINKVEFYGAGCRPSVIPIVRDILTTLLPMNGEVFVASDMLGAAIAACGQEEGIAAILGTGANSCLFDGENIVANTPALGFILGDEGGGAVMGKHFLNAIFKGGLPTNLKEDFLAESGLTLEMIIERVYQGKAPNRFLASISPFIHKKMAGCPSLRSFVINEFRAFFDKNIRPYNRPELPVNVVGSMGYYYESEVREAATLEGFTVGSIIKSPIDGLI